MYLSGKVGAQVLSDSEIHAGYAFEDGMFSRMRSWVDVAPWIRLTRVLRILASPAYVGLVAIALVVTVLSGVFQVYDSPVYVGVPVLWLFDSFTDRANWIQWSGGIYQTFFSVAFLLLLWIPVIQCISRGGAALTSGRSLPSARRTVRLTASRLGKSYLVPIVPVLCILTFLAATFLIRVPSLFLDFAVIQFFTGAIIGIVSIPIGILGFGALFAIPLGIVAMVCERDPDAIDSLSRGYEFLFRRPLSLAWYLVVSGVLVYAASYLLGGVGWASSLAVTTITSTVFPDQIQLQAALGMIGLCVVAWLVTLAFALLGGVYLMLRRDACGQEVEDLWEPQPAPSEPLPSLPKEAYES